MRGGGVAPASQAFDTGKGRLLSHRLKKSLVDVLESLVTEFLCGR